MFGKAFEILSCHYNMTVQNRCHKNHTAKLSLQKLKEIPFINQ